MKSLMRNLGIPNMITATNCEQSGVIGEGSGGYTADRERKGRIECEIAFKVFGYMFITKK